MRWTIFSQQNTNPLNSEYFGTFATMMTSQLITMVIDGSRNREFHSEFGKLGSTFIVFIFEIFQ